MRGLAVVMSLMLFCEVPSATPMPQKRACKGKREVVGDCFKIHGRLREYNGIAYRIWWIGKDRLVGADDGDIPDKLDVDYGMDVFGDFEVCPLTKQREGEMQMVCVESVSNIMIVDHRPEDKGGKAIVRKLVGQVYH
jgi:hypothetical protein